MKLFNVEKSKNLWEKIIPPAVIIILLFAIIFFIFESKFTLEDKIILSITLIIISIFCYLKEFNKKFQNLLKRKIIQKFKKIGIIIVLILGLLISVLFIRNYIITKLISQLIVGIFFGLSSILLLLSKIFQKKFK